MDEKLDAVVSPHPPFPFSDLRGENHLEINPVWLDAIVYAVVGLDPVSVEIAWIGFLGAEASVDKYILNASSPKGVGRGSQSL